MDDQGNTTPCGIKLIGFSGRPNQLVRMRQQSRCLLKMVGNHFCHTGHAVFQ
ncbi:Uncharacterised protein [Vibrio cholerae]|nr:Uncharacterised protein [Vibrio cholerae]